MSMEKNVKVVNFQYDVIDTGMADENVATITIRVRMDILKSKTISYIITNNELYATRKAYRKARFKKMLSRAIKHELRNENE